MEFQEVILRRQSIRQYDPEKQVKEDQLERILEAGMAAPISRKDYQSITFCVIQNRELLEEMARRYGGTSHPFYHVPTLILIVSQPTVIDEIAYMNVANVMVHMALAATECGLGSIYLTTPFLKMKNDQSMLEELRIPEGTLPIAALGVGYALKPLEKQEIDKVKQRIKVIRHL